MPPPGPAAPPPPAGEEPPIGTWTRLYSAVIAAALVVMALIALFSSWQY